MIIVTPAKGSVPEPRPQALITGDRAVVLLNDGGVSVAAMSKAGVQTVTVTKSVYDELTSELGPQTSTDVDPATGYLKTALLPPYLSQAAIAALNVLDGTTHKVSDSFLPDRLTTASLTALVAQQNSTQLVTDPDGTPVVLGGGDVTGVSATYSGTVSANTVSAGVLHGDLFTATNGSISFNEVHTQIWDAQSVAPVAPSAGKVTSYLSATNRLSLIDATGQTYLIGNKRLVTAWPSAADSQLGDEAILSATGEHRIYKGATQGWRLASTHSVASQAERDALVPYTGMKVYCAFGHEQEQVYRADHIWHGTRSYPVAGGTVRAVTAVNDTNFKRWNQTEIDDPGYPFFLTGRLGLEVYQSPALARAEIWVSLCDQVTGANNQVIAQTYYDARQSASSQSFNRYGRMELAIQSPASLVQTGNRLVNVDWRVDGNKTGAQATAYKAWNDYVVHPA